jgi:hypothetical protein
VLGSPTFIVSDRPVRLRCFYGSRDAESRPHVRSERRGEWGEFGSIVWCEARAINDAKALATVRDLIRGTLSRLGASRDLPERQHLLAMSPNSLRTPLPICFSDDLEGSECQPVGRDRTDSDVNGEAGQPVPRGYN